MVKKSVVEKIFLSRNSEYYIFINKPTQIHNGTKQTNLYSKSKGYFSKKYTYYYSM